MLSEELHRGLETRGITRQFATSMGLYSGKHSPDGSVHADEAGNVLCIPYFEGIDEVNAKFRWRDKAGKRFQQRPGCPKTFYNANVLLNEATMAKLEKGEESLIITEGEFDCWSAIMAGFETSVSVPDGAPPARDKNGNLIDVPDDAKGLDPENDVKFSFLARHMAALQRVKTFKIATDNDDPGKRLAKELVRRLGAARCYWIEYPKDDVVKDAKTGEMRPCKDLNEVHLAFGLDRVKEIIENANPWPVKGLYKLSEYPDHGEPMTFPTGLCDELDEIFRPYPGAFIVATGIPGMGKSTLVNQMSVNMAVKYGWSVAMFSGEMPTVPYISNALMTAFLGKPRSRWTADDRARAHAFVERHYRFIDQDPREDEDEIDVEFLIEKAATAVFRDGVKMLIIDPWNELEHTRNRHFSITEYVGEAIRKLKRFARSYECCVVVVAHPKKVDHCPGLYDISDSAHWANKADLGLVVHSDDPMQTRRTVIVPKVRFSSAGRRGEIQMDFDRDLELFIPAEETAPA